MIRFISFITCSALWLGATALLLEDAWRLGAEEGSDIRGYD
jgi:hypothetical protein